MAALASMPRHDGSRASTAFDHTRWCNAERSNVKRGPDACDRLAFTCGWTNAASVASSISKMHGVRWSAMWRNVARIGAGLSTSASTTERSRVAPPVRRLVVLVERPRCDRGPEQHAAPQPFGARSPARHGLVTGPRRLGLDWLRNQHCANFAGRLVPSTAVDARDGHERPPYRGSAGSGGPIGRRQQAPSSRNRQAVPMYHRYGGRSICTPVAAADLASACLARASATPTSCSSAAPAPHRRLLRRLLPRHRGCPLRSRDSRHRQPSGDHVPRLPATGEGRRSHGKEKKGGKKPAHDRAPWHDRRRRVLLPQLGPHPEAARPCVSCSPASRRSLRSTDGDAAPSTRSPCPP